MELDYQQYYLFDLLQQSLETMAAMAESEQISLEIALQMRICKSYRFGGMEIY